MSQRTAALPSRFLRAEEAHAGPVPHRWAPTAGRGASVTARGSRQARASSPSSFSSPSPGRSRDPAPPAWPFPRPGPPDPAPPHLLQEASDIVNAPMDDQPGFAVGVPLPHLLQREHGPGRLLRAAPGLRPLPGLHAGRRQLRGTRGQDRGGRRSDVGRSRPPPAPTLTARCRAGSSAPANEERVAPAVGRLPQPMGERRAGRGPMASGRSGRAGRRSGSLRAA